MELRKRSMSKENEINKYKVKKQKKGNFEYLFTLINNQINLYNLDFLKRKSEIEDLPGEVWFELFAYFDGQSLINIFSQLNSSIESLLSDYRLPIHLNIICSDFLVPFPLNSNQIISLSIDYSHIKNSKIININSFIRLRSLCLMFIKDEQLEKVSQLSLNNLYQISIQSKCAKFLTKIISIYFPNVKRMILNAMGKEFIVKSSDNSKRKIHLEKLTLDGTIKFVKLFRLWSFVRYYSN